MIDLYASDIGDTNKMISRIQDEYGVNINAAKVIGDRKFTADTDRGRLLIRKINDRENHLVFIQGIYSYVSARGFKNYINVHPVKSGKYYLALEDGIYIVTDCADNGCKMTLRENSESAAKLLASFHRCAEGYKPPAGGKCKCNWGKWLDKYRKKAREIKRYRDEVRNKGAKSCFDNMFLKDCDHYIWIIEQAVNILKKKGFLNIVEESMKKKQVCLHDFKPSNLCRIGDELYIKSLEGCRYDIVETDIADFFKEVIKSGDMNAVREPQNLIWAYQEENALSPNSIDIIKALMIFPEEYEKVCSRYYSGKDKWNEETYISKLHQAIGAEEKKMNFVKALGGI